MRASAVIYVGDLDRMVGFYQGCFGLTVSQSTPGYCTLESPSWSLSLVLSAQAAPESLPAPRRSDTAIKLVLDVADLRAARRVATDLGGRVDPMESVWHFQGAARCDCVDPEGNVVQLAEPDRV